MLGLEGGEAERLFTVEPELLGRLVEWERGYLEQEARWAGPRRGGDEP
jgi:hypothetical protein